MKHIWILTLMLVASFTSVAQRYADHDAINLRPVEVKDAGVVYSGKIYYDKTCSCFKFREGTNWSTLIRDGDKGDISVTNLGALFTIDPLAVTTDKIADAAVSNAKIQDLAVTTTKINNGAVTGAKITDKAVAYVDIQDLAAYSVLGRSTGTVGVSSSIAALTDGHVLRRSGTTLGFGTVTTAGLTNNSITSDKINDGAISSLDLADNAVTTAKINNNAVTGAQINDGSIGTLDLADLSVTTAKLNNNAVTSAKITDGTIVDADLANAYVKTSAIPTPIATIEWTPSITNIQNMDASSIPSAWRAVRIGNVIMLSGAINMDPIASSGIAVVDIVPPSSPDWTLTTQASGVAVGGTDTNAVGILTSTTGDLLRIQIKPTSTSSVTFHCVAIFVIP